MHVHLHATGEQYSPAIWEMLQEMPSNEEGFHNRAQGLPLEKFPDYWKELQKMSKGIDLEEGWVPMSTFWLQVNGRYVGFSKVRHELNKALKENGGHVGYGIRPSERGKGYGHLILEETLKKAKDLGLKRVLITIDSTNLPSIKVTQKAGGVLRKKEKGRHYYWIDLSEKQ